MKDADSSKEKELTITAIVLGVLLAAGSVTAIWRNYVRYVGAGAIAVGGFVSLVRSLPTFLHAFKRSGGAPDGEDGTARDGGRDLPMKTVVGCLACAEPCRGGRAKRRRRPRTSARCSRRGLSPAKASAGSSSRSWL